MSATYHQSPMVPAPTRLRQIALVAVDLERAKHLQTKVIGTEVIFVDPAVETWGLRNILVAIGGDIIEVVSPFRSNVTAARLLSKRGEGGYMIIMQTVDAKARRFYLESTGLARCIFTHDSDDAVCIQYHPKGIKGGMIPELDSHTPSQTNPTPVETRFSPWHACGPLSSHPKYSAGMRRHGDLQLLSGTCRLSSEDRDTFGAAKQWENLFGVHANGPESQFTNAKLRFIAGEDGKPDGLVEITIGVARRQRLADIMKNSEAEGLPRAGERAFMMLGLRWVFELVNGEGTGDQYMFIPQSSFPRIQIENVNPLRTTRQLPFLPRSYSSNDVPPNVLSNVPHIATRAHVCVVIDYSPLICDLILLPPHAALSDFTLQTVRAVIDTGAGLSMISPKCRALHFAFLPLYKAVPIPLVGIGGMLHPSGEYIFVEIIIEGIGGRNIELCVKLDVVEFGHDVIIGNDILAPAKAKIQFGVEDEKGSVRYVLMIDGVQSYLRFEENSERVVSI